MEGRWKPGLNEYALGGTILLAVVLVAMAVLFYLAPGTYLQVPELQPAARVTRVQDFPAGSSRVVSWGPKIILVVHSAEGEYAAVDGTSPIDGCILNWDASALRVVSPCSYLVYDLHGNVVRGLTTVPLRRYGVFIQQGTVFVKES